MYDTLNFWLDWVYLKESNPIDILEKWLPNPTKKYNELRGLSINGKINGFYVSCSDCGLFLSGSLAKLYLPSNLYTLTRQTTREAIEFLSDSIHININEAKVTRIDVSTVIPLKQPPADYYRSLGDKNYFKRREHKPNTLYYETEKKQLAFYDKRKEAAAKNAIVPPSLYGCQNLLRYELRYLIELSRQFNTSTITANMLYDRDFYYNIIQQWRDEYNSIQKIKKIGFMNEDKITPKEARDLLFAEILIKMGAQETINDFIADLRANDKFADPKYYSLFKNYLKTMLQAQRGQEEDLTKELTLAINNIAKYAR